MRALSNDRDVIAHVQDVGDVGSEIGDWVGTRGSGRCIEGFSIRPPHGIAADEIEYQALLASERLSPWVAGSKFCGSRGMSTPIRGLRVRLRGRAAALYECTYSARFMDGTESSVITSDLICAAESLAPLEAFQFILRPRAGDAPAGPSHRLILPNPVGHLPKPNRSRIVEQLPIQSGDDIDIPEGARFLFLCFTNRSGSNYLGNLLSASGITNSSDELFNADVVLETCFAHRLRSFQKYFSYIVGERSKGALFFAKVAAEQLVLLVETGILDRIFHASHFALIHRSDKLGQAISLSIAEQTNQWAWYLPSNVPVEKLQFSRSRIGEHLNDITRQEFFFWRFFGWNGIEPSSVHYEALVQEPQEVVNHFTGRLGLPQALIDPGRIELRKQATALNEAWRTRFLSEEDTGTPSF